VLFPTVEHAYQAAKSLDPAEREKIRGASTPGLARKMGRKLTPRLDWADIKVGVMRDLVWQKFEGRADLQRLLMATGGADLVEGNTWHDNFWGDCRCPRCQGVTGENWLGRLLMEVRARLRTAGSA
jgi:hypothetical protein